MNTEPVDEKADKGDKKSQDFKRGSLPEDKKRANLKQRKFRSSGAIGEPGEGEELIESVVEKPKKNKYLGKRGEGRKTQARKLGSAIDDEDNEKEAEEHHGEKSRGVSKEGESEKKEEKEKENQENEGDANAKKRNLDGEGFDTDPMNFSLSEMPTFADFSKNEYGDYFTVSEVENRLRNHVLHFIQPTVERAKKAEARVEELEQQFLNFTSELKELNKMKMSVEHQVDSLDTLRDQISRLEVARLTLEREVAEELALTAKKTQNFNHATSSLQEGIHALQRSQTRMGELLGNIQDQVKRVQAFSEGNVYEIRGTYTKALDDITIRIGQIELNNVRIQDNFFARDEQIKRLATYQEKAKAVLTLVQEKMFEMEEAQCPKKAFTEFQSEVQDLLKQINLKNSHIQGSLQSVVVDVKTHFKLCSDTLSDSVAGRITTVAAELDNCTTQLRDLKEYRDKNERFKASMVPVNKIMSLLIDVLKTEDELKKLSPSSTRDERDTLSVKHSTALQQAEDIVTGQKKSLIYWKSYQITPYSPEQMKKNVDDAVNEFKNFPVNTVSTKQIEQYNEENIFEAMGLGPDGTMESLKSKQEAKKKQVTKDTNRATMPNENIPRITVPDDALHTRKTVPIEQILRVNTLSEDQGEEFKKLPTPPEKVSRVTMAMEHDDPNDVVKKSPNPIDNIRKPVTPNSVIKPMTPNSYNKPVPPNLKPSTPTDISRMNSKEVPNGKKIPRATIAGIGNQFAKGMEQNAQLNLPDGAEGRSRSNSKVMSPFKRASQVDRSSIDQRGSTAINAAKQTLLGSPKKDPSARYTTAGSVGSADPGGENAGK